MLHPRSRGHALIVSIDRLVLEGLSRARLSAAETHYRKVARELALYTLGQVESGLFWEELDGDGNGGTLTGTYAEEGHEDFRYELVLGDQQFQDDTNSRQDGYHDSWKAERERQERASKDSKDKDEKTEEPFEKVRIRVTYPQLTDHKSTLVLERWMVWKQVYGNGKGEAPAKDGESAE